MPSESPLKKKYAPPDRPRISYGAALIAVVAGVLTVTGGAVGFGLLLIAGGAGWGALVCKATRYVDAERAKWERAHVCLACTGTF